MAGPFVHDGFSQAGDRTAWLGAGVDSDGVVRSLALDGSRVVVDGWTETGALTISGDVFASPPGAIIATPSRVQIPMAGLATPTQGWVIARLAMGFDAAGTGEKYVFSWRTDNSNRIGLPYGRDITRWQLGRFNGGTGSGLNVPDNFGAAGAKRTVAFEWTATALRFAFNGGAFASGANSSIPTLPANADIGSFAGSQAYIDSNILWLAIGAGTLTDADSTAVHAIGDTPPTWPELVDAVAEAALPTALWRAVDSSFVKVI